jgi:hypothetical protein
VSLDNHKFGDFKPYLLKSTNRGRSWRSISSNLEDRHLVWRVVQDHVNPQLLFAATEFGLFFTLDGGDKWVELTGNAPTISFRDITIQRREDDLVAASFGRGFFIVDDIAPLRELTEASLEEDALLFPGRDALWYMEQHPLAFSEGGSQGHGYYRAPNPDFGANFTYYLGDDVASLAETRRKAESERAESGQQTPFPSFEAITAEMEETAPAIVLTVRDADGNIVRRLTGPAKKGFHRVNWDLRYPRTTFVSENEDPMNEPTGFLAAPGQYTVSLSKRVRGETTELVAPQPFNVTPLRDQGALPAQADASDFWDDVTAFDRSVTAANITLQDMHALLERLAKAANRATAGDPDVLATRWDAIREETYRLQEALNGNAARTELWERTQPTVRSRLSRVMMGLGSSTYGPTQTHRDQLGYAKADFADIRDRLVTLVNETVPAFEAQLSDAGAPWVPGGRLPF